MEKVIQQNAANAEEGASASQELNAQSNQMKIIVADMVSLVGGNNGASGSPV
jgi:methyl-accepting chemotaxis protein